MKPNTPQYHAAVRQAAQELHVKLGDLCKRFGVTDTEEAVMFGVSVLTIVTASAASITPSPPTTIKKIIEMLDSHETDSYMAEVRKQHAHLTESFSK